MTHIPNAKRSPRIVNGVLCWYEGDTFRLNLTLDLIDQDGEPVEITSGELVTVTFFDRQRRPVKTFVFEGPIENSTVTLIFSDAVSEKFKRGRYTYDIYYDGTDRTTIANGNIAIVE